MLGCAELPVYVQSFAVVADNYYSNLTWYLLSGNSHTNEAIFKLICIGNNGPLSSYYKAGQCQRSGFLNRSGIRSR